jgi:prepilin peptidase CpaA
LPLLLTTAAAVDMRRQRIPNAISLGGALLGLALWTRHEGFAGLEAGLAGWLVGAALFLPFYLLKGIGAGDVKLMAAVGVCLGAYHTLWAGITVAVTGGVIAAWAAACQHRLGAALRDSLRIPMRRLPAAKIGAAAAHEVIPYGLAIAAGTLLYMIVRFVA